MTQAIKVLGQVQLGVGLTTIYTAPSQPPNAKAAVQTLWICNTDAANRTVTIRVGTGTLTAANSLLEGTLIEANVVYIIGDQQGFGLLLNAGESIQGLSDAASKLTVSVFGWEQYD